ncbi:MAG: hypothetical protein Q9175_003256 [Cornicularia normoerica]
MDFNYEIPPDLEAKALQQFDTSLSKGEILYEPPRTSVRWAQGFQVLIRRLRAHYPLRRSRATTDDLDLSDLTAAWAILKQIETPQMIIYNCGVEGGSSQGHKHIQIFPRLDSKVFQMFPSKAKSKKGRSFRFTRILN